MTSKRASKIRGPASLDEIVRQRQKEILRAQGQKNLKERREQEKRVDALLERERFQHQMWDKRCECGHSLLTHREDSYTSDSAEPYYISRCGLNAWDSVTQRYVTCSCAEFQGDEVSQHWIDEQRAKWNEWLDRYMGSGIHK